MDLIIAALQGVPVALYEAAELDGASGPRKFWHITLPMISPASSTTTTARQVSRMASSAPSVTVLSVP